MTLPRFIISSTTNEEKLKRGPTSTQEMWPRELRHPYLKTSQRCQLDCAGAPHATYARVFSDRRKRHESSALPSLELEPDESLRITSVVGFANDAISYTSSIILLARSGRPHVFSTSPKNLHAPTNLHLSQMYLSLTTSSGSPDSANGLSTNAITDPSKLHISSPCLTRLKHFPILL